MSEPRVRFAPSPTGHLHLGTSRTALFNWLFARTTGGRLILRIEDTDEERSTLEFEQSLVADLRWLGIDWDEGDDVGGATGPYRQTLRLAGYRAAAMELLAARRAYRCFCAPAALKAWRDEQRAAGRTPRYPGTCAQIDAEASARRADAGESFAVRLRVIGAAPSRIAVDDMLKGRVEFDGGDIEDLILLRSNGAASYAFAGVLDDVAMGITHVIRGEDLLPATPRQILIYRSLGAKLPRFAHLAMVLGPDGAKLSKRHGAVSIDDYRKKGYLAPAVVNALALLGWSDPEGREVLAMSELSRVFTMDRVSRSSSIFDVGKLGWLNAQHLRLLDGDSLTVAASPWLRERGWDPQDLEPEQRAWLGEVLCSGAAAVELLSELVERTAPILGVEEPMPEAAARVLGKEASAAALGALAKALAAAGGDLHEAVDLAMASTGFGRGKLLKPLRAALTGATSGIELDRLIPLAERGHTLFGDRVSTAGQRIARALAGESGA